MPLTCGLCGLDLGSPLSRFDCLPLEHDKGHNREQHVEATALMPGSVSSLEWLQCLIFMALLFAVRPSAPTTMGTNLVAGARAFCNAPTTFGGLTKVAKPSIAEMRNAARMCEYAAAGEIEQLKEMLAAGDVDISSRDYDLRTALHVAAANGNAEIVEWLLQEGANNQFDRLGGLPVHDAVMLLIAASLLLSRAVTGSKRAHDAG